MADLVLYTAAEVADLLRLNHQVVQRKLQAGEIPGYRIGREWRVEADQLRQWLEAHSNRRPTKDDVDFWFDGDGRLTSIPQRRDRRRMVFERIAEALDLDRTYTEIELSKRLRRFHDDVATLRREMVGERVLVRSDDGIYKRATPEVAGLRRRS